MSELLTIQDIANLYRVSYQWARDRIVKAPDFPKPIPGSTVKRRLWLRESVEQYWRRISHA